VACVEGDQEGFGLANIGRLIFVGHSSQKSPIISGSFAERDLQQGA